MYRQVARHVVAPSMYAWLCRSMHGVPRLDNTCAIAVRAAGIVTAATAVLAATCGQQGLEEGWVPTKLLKWARCRILLLDRVHLSFPKKLLTHFGS